MRGRNGLVLVIFGLIVALARQLHLGHLDQLDIRVVQVVDLITAFGLASAAVGLVSRVWAASS